MTVIAIPYQAAPTVEEEQQLASEMADWATIDYRIDEAIHGESPVGEEHGRRCGHGYSLDGPSECLSNRY